MRNYRSTGTANCPVCDTGFTVDLNEDGQPEMDKRNTYACQGAVPDLCTARMCEECVVKCGACGLPVCEEHRKRVDWDRLPWCDRCIITAAEEELMESARAVPKPCSRQTERAQLRAKAYAETRSFSLPRKERRQLARAFAAKTWRDKGKAGRVQ